MHLYLAKFRTILTSTLPNMPACAGVYAMNLWKARFLQLSQSQQERERQSMRDLMSLFEWTASPGAIAVSEAAVRNVRLSPLLSITRAVDVGARRVLERRFFADPNILDAMASMAATARKLLHSHSAAHMAPDMSSAGSMRDRAAAAHGLRPQPLTHSDRGWVNVCVDSLLMVVTFMDCAMLAETGSKNAHLRFRDVPSQAFVGIEGNQGPVRSQKRTLMLRRIITSLLLTLLQSCALLATADQGEIPATHSSHVGMRTSDRNWVS